MKWFDEKISEKSFKIILLVAIIGYLIYLALGSIFDKDMYFLIATGDEILKNGIPYTNVWTIAHDSKFIAQQWLYCIGMSLADNLGNIGLAIFYLIQFGLFLFVFNHFLSLKKLNKVIRFAVIILTCYCCQTYVFCIRPELITMILLLTECIALEHYRDSGKWQWLILLPVTMLGEINLHASMWPIHYAIILAYCVPAFYWKKKEVDDLHKSIKPILLFLLIMGGVMFINPYGLEAILYIIKSMTSDTFNYIDVIEVQKTTIFSAHGIMTVLGVVMFFVATKFKKLSSVSTNIFVGFTIMACMSLRNSMFLVFVYVFLMRDIAVGMIESEFSIDWRKDLTRGTMCVLLVLDLIAVVSAFSSIMGAYVVGEAEDDPLKLITEYIDSHGGKDSKVFTGFNIGAYFEYKGFHNVYIDARPELYTSEFTGKDNILAEYSKFGVYGYGYPQAKNNDDLYYSSYRETADKWLDKYDFDYIIVHTGAEYALTGYMAGCDRYEVISYCLNDNLSPYQLYRKINTVAPNVTEEET